MTTAGEDGGRVLAFPADATPGYQIVRRAAFCGHRGAREIDPSSRVVTCARCGAALDPFECLQDMAMHVERQAAQLAHIEAATERASERLAELLRQERNARHRLRRAAIIPASDRVGNGPPRPPPDRKGPVMSEDKTPAPQTQPPGALPTSVTTGVPATPPPGAPPAKPVDPDDDPARKADMPRYPAPGGPGEGGSSRNPEGASGPPPGGMHLPPGTKT